MERGRSDMPASKSIPPVHDLFVGYVMGGAPGQGRASEAVQFGLAILGVASLAPLFLVIGLAIKLTSRGPLLRRSLAIGQRGRVFASYAFRTSREAAVATDGAPRLIDDDGRDTAIGRFLKRAGLDRLPQLLHVLQGEMNLLGPRPRRPLFLERWSHMHPRQHRRLPVKPGLMALARRGGQGPPPLNSRLPARPQSSLSCHAAAALAQRNRRPAPRQREGVGASGYAIMRGS